jgi:hypothetical protein
MKEENVEGKRQTTIAEKAKISTRRQDGKGKKALAGQSRPGFLGMKKYATRVGAMASNT